MDRYWLLKVEIAMLGELYRQNGMTRPDRYDLFSEKLNLDIKIGFPTVVISGFIPLIVLVG
ncbi:hypothetical protein [Haloarcula nitratireducens]|uniref:Uncharacterized protein n=1 Tax=Haloarcula nitratireducens TaxID=2487749 RepID=A0AAW4PJJ2_9EURY|nr:hypothetical protein [Halomicroarcula nitratireducens]MBX0298148.1 hypothetical protein [Halomicroarcula nitratireducens]